MSSKHARVQYGRIVRPPYHCLFRFATALLAPAYCPSSIHTVFIFVNSRIPTAPSSRPWPDHSAAKRYPAGPEAAMRLMNTIPHQPIIISRSVASVVQALAPGQNGCRWRCESHHHIGAKHAGHWPLFPLCTRANQPEYSLHRGRAVSRRSSGLPPVKIFAPAARFTNIAVQINQPPSGVDIGPSSVPSNGSPTLTLPFLREQLLELVGNAFRHDESLCRNADCPLLKMRAFTAVEVATSSWRSASR